MKILVLTDGIFPFVVGGMQRHSSYLVKYLALRGHEVTVVHCTVSDRALPGPDEVNEALGLEKGRVHSIALRFPKLSSAPGHYIKESYVYSRHVYGLVADRLSEFDFVYAKGFSAWYLLEQKQKRVRVPPTAVKFHGYEMFQPPASLKSRFEHWLLRGPVKWNTTHADVVFSYGGKITPIIETLGVSLDRIEEVPTGIEEAWLAPEVRPTSGKRKFLFLGRWERRKGVEELMQAIGQLPDPSAFELHYIGPVPPSKRSRHTSVIYHGSITEAAEIRRIMDECHVMVVPSHSEGMPNVILEGMSRGLAILATDVGAVGLQVDASNGWLLPPADVKALTDGMLRCIDMEDETIDRLRSAAVRKVREQFLWPDIAAQIERAILRHRE